MNEKYGPLQHDTDTLRQKNRWESIDCMWRSSRSQISQQKGAALLLAWICWHKPLLHYHIRKSDGRRIGAMIFQLAKSTSGVDMKNCKSLRGQYGVTAINRNVVFSVICPCGYFYHRPSGIYYELNILYQYYMIVSHDTFLKHLDM